MSEKSEYRRNATGRVVGGLTIAGAGQGIKTIGDKKFRLPVETNRNVVIGTPKGPVKGTLTETKNVKPTIMHAVKNKQFTSTHAKYLATKLHARSVQGAGIGVALVGAKQLSSGQKNKKFSLKHEVVRPLVHADAIEAHADNVLSKSDKDQLVRSKNRARKLSIAGGTIGGTALVLRAPELASVLVKNPKSKVISSLKEAEPKFTRSSNALLATGGGVGAVGAFNNARVQRLENERLAAVKKSDRKEKEKMAAVGVAGVAGGAAFPTLQKTPHDNGASVRINTQLNGTHAGHVNIEDVRGIARTPGKRYGAKQNQAKLTSTMRRENFNPDHPITVSRFANGQMVVTNGHHRLHAAEDLGHKKVPIVVRNETGKAPRSVVPLHRAGKHARDIVDARQPRGPLDAKGLEEMENLAAKGTPKHIERANKVKSISEEIPHNLNTPRNKIGLAAVAGAGVSAYAGSKLHKERKVSKRDDKFLTQYRDRISPNAEAGYKHLRRGVKSRQLDAGTNAVLGAGLIGHAGHLTSKKHFYVAGLEGVGGALTLKSAHNSANDARVWNAKVNAIKAKAKQREAEGIYGKDRHVDMAKSIMVEKGLSVGLPYPKGMRRAGGVRVGHLMHTRSGKTVSVRGSVG